MARVATGIGSIFKGQIWTVILNSLYFKWGFYVFGLVTLYGFGLRGNMKSLYALTYAMIAPILMMGLWHLLFWLTDGLIFGESNRSFLSGMIAFTCVSCGSIPIVITLDSFINEG